MYKRTAGDGMESKSTTETKIEKLSADYAQSIKKKPTTTATTPRLIEIIVKGPVKVKSKKQQIYSKNPKFVPYEPYAGAVRPIVPHKLNKDPKRSKNRMNINTLITQMSQMDTRPSEFKPRNKINSQTECSSHQEWNKEKSDMKREIESLRKENEILKDQVKQQVQVNKELKTMLVASMGEDLETQVQSLNDDKRHLADALINSAQHLSTHQEQTEWLAGQCEVWRSKFLASSLMIEELAAWKHALSQRTEELQQTMKHMLEERCRAREMCLQTYKNLWSMHKNWLQDILIAQYQDDKKFQSQQGITNFGSSFPQTVNLMDLASVNLKLSDNISSSYEKVDINHLLNLPMMTEAEKNAEQIMSKSIDVKRVNETPVNALVHHAQNRRNTLVPPIASCIHCNGQVQLL